jgi:hypothetical protein
MIITIATFLMTVSVVGFAYLVGNMHGYNKGASDIERMYNSKS